MKRFLYLFTIIAAVALVILIGYFLRYRAGSPLGGILGNLPSTPNQSGNQTITPNTETEPQGAGSLPTATSGKFGLVAQNPAMNFFADENNGTVIVQPDGQIVKVVNGEASILSSSVIAKLISAEFSSDGKKILAAFGDPFSPQESIFDVVEKSWQPLPPGAKSATWAPTGYQIAYLKDGSDYRSLITLDVSNAKTKPQELAKLHVQDVDLAWVRLGQIFLTEKSSAAIISSVWSLDVKTKKLSLILEGFGLESLWSKAASNIGLVFTANTSKRGGVLSLTDLGGNTLTRLKISTLPSKCTFAAEGESRSSASNGPTSSSSVPTTRGIEVLYCGIPRKTSVFFAARLPDNYEKRSVFGLDDLYKINLSDGNTTPIFNDPSQQFDASELKVFNQNLFFINRFDKKVYGVSLK